ncbi:MAG: flagellar biosynthetic protein FliO [bacterium]|nr:flagellar biosynthetic protein FliO [bacterium]MDW8163681.1 flagellar biosynthetic protein FliO [Candidatus Omnitrophota bacterium]
MEFYKTSLFFFVVTIIFLIVLFFVIFSLKKLFFPFFTNEVKIIKSFSIERKCKILIVEIFDKIYFLGITESGITILEKVDDKEKINKIKEKIENEIVKRKNVLKIFKK